MKNTTRLAAPAAFALASLALAGAAQAAGFNLKSADLKPNQTIPFIHVMDTFGCTGGNKSPQLSWSGAPRGTKSFAVTVYDPDAPTGSGWWHWLVYNLPPDTKELGGGIGKGASLPAGAKEGKTDIGKPGFIGPCPPPGDKAHRYIFTVHALKVDKLDVPDDAMPALIGFMINANRIGKASFTAVYKR